MKVITEHKRNNLRFERLSKDKKEVINHIALQEFNKPLKERYKAVQLLDFVEFLID